MNIKTGYGAIPLYFLFGILMQLFLDRVIKSHTEVCCRHKIRQTIHRE